MTQTEARYKLAMHAGKTEDFFMGYRNAMRDGFKNISELQQKFEEIFACLKELKEVFYAGKIEREIIAELSEILNGCIIYIRNKEKAYDIVEIFAEVLSETIVNLLMNVENPFGAFDNYKDNYDEFTPFPEEAILLIDFLKPENFYSVTFGDRWYEVIGKDDVGNLIGTDRLDKVYYLDTENSNAFYAAGSVKTFVGQLELYKNYSEECNLPSDPSEDELEEYVNGFKRRLEQMDLKAFDGDYTFWSLVAEQMEYEQL